MRSSSCLLASVLVIRRLSSVPTSGPIEEVEGQQTRGCQSCVNVEVLPPAPDDKPRQIVEGFLRATSNYQPNYTVARQFLTPMAAEKWSPDAGVSIYRAAVIPTGTGHLRTERQWLVGSIGNGPHLHCSQPAPGVQLRSLQTRMVDWRIDNPPPGLWVSEVSFKFFYQSYDLYFVGNNRSLVPDPIYLPALSNPANVASALIKALLNGPSKWLKPAVSTAIPPNTSLSVDSVTITDGIAEVALGESILALPDAQRSLLAAQIAFTLKQVGGVKGVVIKVNQQPYRVPGADPNSQVISVDAIPRELDPIPSVAGEQAYARQQEGVGRTSDAVRPIRPQAIRCPDRWVKRYPVNAVAVSVTNTDLAVTTNARTTLTSSSDDAGGIPQRLAHRSYRAAETAVQQVWRDLGNREPGWPATNVDVHPRQHKAVRSPRLRRTSRRSGSRRTARGWRWYAVLRMAPSSGWHASSAPTNRGSRPGDVLTPANPAPRSARSPTSPGLIPPNCWCWERRAETPRFSGWRRMPHSSLRKGEAQDFDAVELAVSPQTQSVIMVGSRGRTWKDDGTSGSPSSITRSAPSPIQDDAIGTTWPADLSRRA